MKYRGVFKIYFDITKLYSNNIQLLQIADLTHSYIYS